MMETGRYGTINELAAAEKINASYVSQLLRLTLLAQGIVEATLDGRQPKGGMLGLLDVQWWDATATQLNSVQLGSLKREIGRLGEAIGDEALVLGEIVDGRFGVLGGAGTDTAMLSDALQTPMANFVPGFNPRVEATRSGR